MVGWFDPDQLLRTGLRTVVSKAFGQHADRRVLDALVQQRADPYDVSAGREVWLDYVSDTGDGWNPTYAVAYHAARPTLEVRDPDGRGYVTRRGQVLVFGGDQVYPTPSRDAYERRLVAPYTAALAEAAGPPPSVFAVPGNHDWYDSLVSFTRLFCTTRDRLFGGWVARQTRSYFAVRLPAGWWLIGTDVQLDSDIDDPQLEYFRSVAEQMAPDDRVILCTAEPHWIYEARYRGLDPALNERNLTYLERDVFRGRIAVFLAGDLHHYRRHAAPDGRQKITAGGGGAFVSATHHDVGEIRRLDDGFVYQDVAYPPVDASRRLSWRNLAFPWLNPKFGLATAVLYLLLGWSVKADVGRYGLGDVRLVLGELATRILLSQTAVMWGLVVVAGFVFFTDTRSKTQKRLGGSLHALANLVAAFLSGWLGSYVAQHVVPGWSEAAKLVIVGLFLLAGGYLAGGLLMGVYLLVSLNAFGRHDTEAFSSLRVQDFRSWLRLHVTADGTLRIYPMAIRRVPRRWKAAAAPRREDGDLRGLLEPDDPRATEPSLVEPPIVVAAGTRRGGA
jgi:hypothetical protein